MADVKIMWRGWGGRKKRLKDMSDSTFAEVVALPANSGVDIGDVDVTSVVPGTGATNLGKVEDAAHASGDVGVMALGVRMDTPGVLAGTDMDYHPLVIDTVGRLRVYDNTLGTLVLAEDNVHLTGQAGIQALAVSAAAPTATAGAAGDYQPLCVSSVDGSLFTRSIANGTALTLKAAGAQTESTNGSGVVCGQYRRLAILLDVTVADTDAGDTLDVYIDVLGPDGATWINAVHFNQIIGTDSAVKYWAVLDTSNPGTATFNVTSDAAEEAVRPYLFGSQIRYRSVIADAGTDDASFTYAVTAYAQ